MLPGFSALHFVRRLAAFALLLFLSVLPVSGAISQSFNKLSRDAAMSCCRTKKSCCCRKGSATPVAKWTAGATCDAGCFGSASLLPSGLELAGLASVAVRLGDLQPVVCHSLTCSPSPQVMLSLLQRPPPFTASL
jgi:hypothetical protein